MSREKRPAGADQIINHDHSVTGLDAVQVQLTRNVLTVEADLDLPFEPRRIPTRDAEWQAAEQGNCSKQDTCPYLPLPPVAPPRATTARVSRAFKSKPLAVNEGADCA